MVNVFINRKDQRIVSFKVEGHSKWDYRGRDIVCAGISAIVQTAIYGLISYLGIKADVIIKDGYIKCSIPHIDDEIRGKADIVLETMVIGLREMEKVYPKHLKVTD